MSEVVRTKTADEKFCFECGQIIRARAEICPHCGVRQLGEPPRTSVAIAEDNRPDFAPPEVTASRNRLAAALFALILGGIGVHKFYLGRPLQGIVYLLFCWTLIPAFIGLIEGLVYLTMTDRDFAKKYH